MLSVTVCVALCLVVIVRIYFLKTVRLLYTNSYKYLRLAFIKSETRTVLRRVAPVPPLHYADACMQDAEREWDGQTCLCLNVEKKAMAWFCCQLTTVHETGCLKKKMRTHVG